MDSVAGNEDFRFSLTGWLLFAVVIHLLLISRLPPDFWRVEQDLAIPPPIAVVLKRETAPPSVHSEPAVPEPVLEKPAVSPEPAPAQPARKPVQRPQPLKEAGPEPWTETQAPRAKPRKPARVDLNRLQEALRRYRLPEQDGQPFTRTLPPDVDAEAFEENTAARTNHLIHEYDGHGGAEVVRVRQFGKEDRCFLVHRVGFDVEREDWDPGMETMVGWGAEEIACD